MNVYILADMEGATGITHGSMLGPEGAEYARGRRLLVQDVNAAVRGAFSAGAKKVVVADGHGNMRNIILEDLDERVELISGPLGDRPYGQIAGLARGKYDAAVLVAFHSMAGTKDGVLSHTWIGGVIHKVAVNGKPVGEIALDAAAFGTVGVPVVAVTSDAAGCREAKRFLGRDVGTAVVKTGLTRSVALLATPKKTARLIETAVEKGFGNRRSIKPYVFRKPVEVAFTFSTAEQAEKGSKSPGAKLKDGRTVAFSGRDYLEVLEASWEMLRSVITPVPAWLK